MPRRQPRPLIGITSMPLVVGDRPVLAVHREYVVAVRRAGGLPVTIPCDEPDTEDFLAHVQGLVLSGGGDVGPDLYGAAPARETSGVDPGRDEVESAWVRRAVDVGLPVLGVCRGCQVINATLGGTLVQHLPSTGRNHLVMGRRDQVSHSVDIAPGSLLERIVGSTTVGVNSIHHQAVDELAPPLDAVGWAPDGLVEAVQHRTAPMLGVQWHPESLQGEPAHDALFTWLVTQACEYGERRDPT